MARKSALRDLRYGTVINQVSSRQEKALASAVVRVGKTLTDKFPGLKIVHTTQWLLKDVVKSLREVFPEVDSHYFFDTSAMRPDGGITTIVARCGESYPILIAEKKNQGTNNLRADEGKPKQAKGNAIERLGKNVIGFRTAMKSEAIFPFVCFGDGCDFDDDSSILDRVVTIAMFGHLNREYLHKLGGGGEFDRGSFYFRVQEWTEDEMFQLSLSIAIKSVYYYFSKYGAEQFVNV